MNNATIKPIPQGMHTVTPHLVCARATEAIDFYKKAFGAEELSRLPGPDGRLLHASVRIGDSVVMLTDEFPERNCLGPADSTASPVAIHLYVNDADGVFQQAQDAGATVVMPIAGMFWGDRYGILRDPFGHRWSVATHKRDIKPEEMLDEMRKMSPDCSETVE